MTVSLQEKKGYYYAVVSFKEGAKYKQKWIALGLPVRNNKRRAEAMLPDILRQYEEKYSTSGEDVLFTTYILRWLDRKRGLIEVSTWEGYQIYAEKHIIPYFEPMKLTLREVKPQHIKEYYEYKYTNGRLDGKPGGLSIASIKKHSIVINDVFNDALVEDLVIRNPAEKVKLPAKDISTREKVFLLSEEANRMLSAFQGHPLEAVVYVTIYYGLRRSEVLGLKWSAVDFDRNTLTINHTVVKNRSIVAKDKTKNQSSYHTYQLIPDVKRVLLQIKERQASDRKALGRCYNYSEYIFTRPDGTLLRPDYVTRGFQRVLKAHGIPMMRFHDLRHSTASILYDLGWDLKESQSWLRHSSIEMTGDTYTHVAENRRSALAQRLNSTFRLNDAHDENNE